MVELYLHSLICLHGIVLNELSTGTTLPFTNASREAPKYVSGFIILSKLWRRIKKLTQTSIKTAGRCSFDRRELLRVKISCVHPVTSIWHAKQLMSHRTQSSTLYVFSSNNLDSTTNSRTLLLRWRPLTQNMLIPVRME
jgi:hypothetical protein